MGWRKEEGLGGLRWYQGAGEGEGFEKPGHSMVQEGRGRAWVSVKTIG